MSLFPLATLTACLAVVAMPLGCSAGTSSGAGASGSGAAGGVVGYGAAASGASGGGPSGGGTPGAGGATSAPGGGTSASGASNGSGGVVTTVGTASSGYDPGVVFDWPEATGDAGLTERCKPGHYVGTFQCDYVPAGSVDGSAGIPLNGPIDMHLDQGMSGEFLTVSGGKLTGATGLAIVFNADVVGQLDCATGAFLGSLQNGVYNFFIFPGGNFAGPFNGTFKSGAIPTLSGTWQLQTVGSNTGACNGTWTVAWSPT